MLKNVFLGTVIAMSCVACGNNNNEDRSTTSTTESKQEATTQDNAGTQAQAGTTRNGISQEDYEKGLTLVAQSDCLTCHDINERKIGPSYSEIAAKYPVSEENITMLADKVIKGGAGNWGQVPMTAHPQLSQEDAKQMVKYVLALKK